MQYVMHNPTSFLNANISYDKVGFVGWNYYPKSLNTRDKVCIDIHNNGNRLSNKSGVVLLDDFKRNLEVIYSFIKVWVTDMDTDVVARFHSKGDILLGYFCQGEYHLWGD